MGGEKEKFDVLKKSFLSFEKDLNENFFHVEMNGAWEKVEQIGIDCVINYRKFSGCFEFCLEIKEPNIILPLSMLEDPVFLLFLKNQFSFFLDLTSHFWEMFERQEVLRA